MKKIYETPNAEIIKFNYRDQIVVASSVEYSTDCIKVSPGNSGNNNGNGNQYGHYVGNQGK